MRALRRLLLALGMCLLFIGAAVSSAQTTGTVEGTVTDESGTALPGVTVELTSPSLQGSRASVSGADGHYRFPSVPPGNYKVTGELASFGKVEKAATVTLDATATVNLQMSISTTAEVTVTGEAPLVDTTSTTTGTNYSAKVIDKLPVGRNYAAIVLSQPGVQIDNGESQGRGAGGGMGGGGMMSTAGNGGISVYGASSAENLFLIDGVNTTNVIKGFQGKDINNEFIQEVEVKTGGYQAEYGRNTGGVINVITKSGGNEFHGGLFGYYNQTNWRADQAFVRDADYSQSGDAVEPGQAVLPKDNRQEFGADLGGFILKDKVWFFGAYDRVANFQEIEPVSGPETGNAFPADAYQNKYSGKLTINPLQGTSIVGSYFSDRQSQTGTIVVPQGSFPASYLGRIDTGGPDYAARLNQLFGSFGIATFQYSHHEDRFHVKPSQDIPQVLDYTPTVFPSADDPSKSGVRESLFGFGSVFGPTSNNESKRDSYQGSFTGYVGNHELKVGGDYQKDDTFGDTFFTGGTRLRVRPCTQSGASVCDLALAPTWTNSAGNATPVFFQHDFNTANAQDLTPLINAPFDTPTNRWSAFVQDQWRVIPTLTFNAGVRYDAEDLYRGRCPAGVDPAATHCGELAFSLKNEWAPRFGFVWDFIGDGTSKAYGSLGRFYYAIPTDLNARVFTANTGVQTYNYSPTDLTQFAGANCSGTVTANCAPRTQNIQVGSYLGEPVDPGLGASYQDELTLGVEKALDPTLSVGLKGTYRTLGRTIEDRCDLDYSRNAYNSSCALFNPGATGPENPGATGAYPSCNGSANPTDPTAGQCFDSGPAISSKAKRIFRGIELTARKQFSDKFYAQASYLYSSLRGNYSGAVQEISGQTDPGINATYDYPQLNVNTYGNLDLDRPHQARIDAVYNASFGLSAGVQFYVRSGVPVSRNGFFNGFYTTEIFEDPRGTVFGESVRTPTDYDANLSLAYNVNLGPVTVTPQLYIFNVLNRQTPTAYDTVYNPNASFVTNPASPFYGQAGVEPGTSGPDGVPCAAGSAHPCPDNPEYGKTVARTNPRLFRAAIKLTF